MTGVDRRDGKSRYAATHLRFSAELGVDISGEKLDCEDMLPFNSAGSANPAIYWAPEQVSILLDALPLSGPVPNRRRQMEAVLSGEVRQGR